MNALNFWWRFGWEAVVALLSMRENIDKMLELMQQEVDDPGFLERKSRGLARHHHPFTRAEEVAR
jgi:hypothetical protein